MSEVLRKTLLKQLQCPECNNYLNPPIQLCSGGHNICKDCRNSFEECPVCRCTFTQIRNLSFEVLSQVKYTCTNLGCNQQMLLMNMKNHEDTCEYRKIVCPILSCTWKGSLNDAASHWRTKKMKIKPYDCNNLCHTKLQSESYFVNLMQAYNEVFWFKNKISGGMLYFVVQYVGPADKADHFYYEVEFFEQTQPQNKLILGDYCQNIHIEHTRLFQKETCSHVDMDSIIKFVGVEKDFVYSVRLYEVQNNNQAKLTTKAINNAQYFLEVLHNK